MASTRRGGSRARAAVVALPTRRGAGSLGTYLPSGRSVVLGLALLALSGGTYAAARETSLFAVEQVRVSGGTPAIARRVHEVLDAERGSSLLALDAGLLARVEAIPDVRSASYDRAFPHTLVVSVRRELPAAVLRRGTSSWLLSERGRVLRPLGRGEHPRLPRVYSGKGGDPSPGELLTQAGVALPLRVVRALGGGFPLRVRSAALDHGTVLLVLDGGLELRLGEARDVEAKLAVAATILTGLARPAAGGPDYLDVSVPERPVSGTNPRPAT